MKIELDIPEQAIEAIARAVVVQIAPLLNRVLKTQPSTTVEALLGVEELASCFGLSKDWIYQRTANNEMPFIKVGRLVKFRKSEIEKWISTQSVPAVAPLYARLPNSRARDLESHDAEKTPCDIAKV